jgi:hypothetical protein
MGAGGGGRKGWRSIVIQQYKISTNDSRLISRNISRRMEFIFLYRHLIKEREPDEVRSCNSEERSLQCYIVTFGSYNFYPEHGNRSFLRNIDNHLPDYTELLSSIG